MVQLLYSYYTWPLTARILHCELALANKSDKPKQEKREIEEGASGGDLMRSGRDRSSKTAER